MGLKTISEQYRQNVLALNLKTPTDIIQGLTDLSGAANMQSYLDAIGKDVVVHSLMVKNPGDITNNAKAPRQLGLGRNDNDFAPDGYDAHRIDLGSEATINDYNVINSGDLGLASIKPRAVDLNKNLSDITPDEFKTHRSDLGTDVVINDYNVKNPGDVISESEKPRGIDLSRNDKNITPDGYSSFRSDLGTDTILNDYTVNNPDTISNTSNKPRNLDLSRNNPNITPDGYKSLANDRGTETSLSNYKVVDIGAALDNTATKELKKSMLKNKPINDLDPSESDQLYSSEFSYTYSSLLHAIGKTTIINDYNIPNITSISSLGYQSNEVMLNLMLQQNRFIPVDLNTYEPIIKTLKNNQNTQPYVEAYKSGVYSFDQPSTYEVSQFLNISTATSPLSILTNVDPMESLLNGNVVQPLKNETMLMNIAALQLKFNFETRLLQNMTQETILRTRIDEAMTNPNTLFDLISNPKSWFEKDNRISVSSNPVGKAVQLFENISGINLPFSFMNYKTEDYIPKCYGNTTSTDSTKKTALGKFINDLVGRTARNDRDMYFLNHTGDGQKAALFANISVNKYSPNYANDYENGLFQAGEDVAQIIRGISGFLGLGAGKRPVGDYYIGSKTKKQDPFYIMQDADGDIVRTTENMTNVLTQTSTDIPYDEPGYDEVSEYGSIETNFVWKKNGGGDTIYDPKNKISYLKPNNIRDTDKFSYNKNFIECSILGKTEQLLEKGINDNYGSPIDQTLTKFFDGYVFTSRANSTITPTVIPKVNSKGEVIGNRYLVPGLDETGKRSASKMFYDAKLCRVWTKDRPYKSVIDTMRYKELTRRERNSVLDRFGNLNIYPTELNVNTSVKKYMFSIENLAWRDTAQQRNLKACEKGPNGGRIMWFPPYDIRFTDDTSSNWTTHQFLGRPEPIYTYNNTERSGTLSFKIVVDHPSVLNLLVRKELAKLTDGEVDEILNAFWSGCIEFDIFELARIWNQFSQSDIEYFKAVIGGINMSKTNDMLKPELKTALINKSVEEPKFNNTNNITPPAGFTTKGLMFENDVPLDPSLYNMKTGVYDSGVIESFGKYFDAYKKLNISNISDNVQVIKKLKDSKSVNADWLRYYYTLGNGSGNNYFMINDHTESYYGFDKQQTEVANILKDTTYNGFDLMLNLTPYTSVLGTALPSDYNKSLGLRRVKSVIKWLLVDGVMAENNKIFDDVDGANEITKDNIDSLLSSITTTDSKSSFTVWRDMPFNPAQTNGVRDKITFIINPASIISFTAATTSINPTATNIKTNLGDKYFVVHKAPTENNTAVLKDCYCFETNTIKDKYVSDSTKIGVTDTIEASQIGTFDPAGKTAYSYADTVCSALSIESAYSRRIDISLTVLNKPVTPNKPESVKEPTFITVETLDPLNEGNITKREIAQRILDRLITEGDYFDVLKEDAPIVYNSLKEKLKYFIPGMHSMTPEGLNSRLTFLQQCMRPGETIRRNENDTCDAANTAFGKPPICVLRLGDLYNTKMIITNLNISYDPLIWDLNPEGIGVQPMIANISMSVKYIGGSGLRTYVEELQNALSFNYYANTDIYDERSYANTNESEKALINKERSFFDGNQLDLIPIINAGEKYVQDKFNETLPGGTIGVVTLVNQPSAPGGIYADFINNSTTYDSGTVYQTYNVVYYNNNFYMRKADSNATYGISGNTLSNKTPTDTTYWKQVDWRNYGEQGFLFEYVGSTQTTYSTPISGGTSTVENVIVTGNTSEPYLSKRYFNTYEVEYYDVFKDLYTTYADLIVDNFKYNKLSSNSSILRLLLLNKNYNTYLTGMKETVVDQETGILTTTISSPIDGLNNLPIQSTGITKTISGLTSGTTDNKFYLYQAFDKEANNRNYVEYGNINNMMSRITKGTFKPNAIKLHLYPQEYLYKIGNGYHIISGFYDDNSRFNPGNLTNGNGASSEVGGVYMKDFSYYDDNINGLFGNLKDEMKAKLKLELSHFWFKTPESVNTYKNYLNYFESTHRKIFTDYLIEKLENYYNDLKDTMGTSLSELTDKTGKFATLLSGISVITEGYDVRLGDKNQTLYYEVIPNGKKLSVQADSIFGYEPYDQYKTSSLNNHEIIDFSECSNYSYLATTTPVSNDNRIKFLSMGNGNYMFKQLSNNQYIQSISKSGYTVNNLMVQSSALNTGVGVTLYGTTPNFELFSNVSGTSGITINSIQDYTSQLNVNGTTVKTLTNGSGIYDSFYGMKYTFEKINYELFDFSNKTIDIMLSDNFINDNFDLDILINNSNNFITQITGITSDATKLFYYLDKSSYKDVSINYYTYQAPTTSSIYDEITGINNFLIYDIPITTELYNNSSMTNSSVIGQNIHMSGLLDILFLDFFLTISDVDKVNIMTILKKPENKPTLGISVDAKTSAKQISDRYNKISNTLDSVFTIIKSYTSAAANKLTNISAAYNTNYDVVKSNVNNIFTNDVTWKDVTTDMIVPTLIKGSESDYTLSMRDTKNIKTSVKENYKVFINNRNTFNIINTNQNKQTIIGPLSDTGTTLTELSKYEIGR
jgi:hypothetical protein